MFRYLPALLLVLPIWAQFETAQQQYPQQYPQPGNPQSGYPQYQQPQQQQGTDDQSRDFASDQQHGVARLRMAQGDVNIKRGDNGQLTGAIMNAPLLSHDHLETGPGSRAEIELDGANVIRMAPDSDMAFANLVYQRSQVQLGVGTIIVRVLRDSQAQVEIDTPSVAFRPLSQGEYRISVFDNGTSQISVRSGRVEMDGPRGSQTVNAGQSLMVRGDPSDPEFQASNEMPRDQLDDWSASRDAEMMASRSSEYVGSDVDGAEDLDRYGNWVPSQYGQVWAPQGQAADWSPYSNGQWNYADYYGWTWVGYEPWGWAPYHYGSWFWNTGVGWCWWPGARGGFGFRWSPARVGFFGFGGGLGWVALAPFEVFHPWWGRGFRGFDSYRSFGIRETYRNAGIRGGAMTAGFNGFAGAGHRYSVATTGVLGGASLIHGGLPVSPNSGGYRFSERAVSGNTRFSQMASRPFFSRQQGFNTPRSSFSTPRPTASAPSAASGWQHFGSPGASAPQRQTQSFTSRPNTTSESGWHSFGAPQQAPRSSYSAPASPSYNYRAPSASAPRYNYSAPAAPRYNSAPRYSAPPAQHYSAPAAPHYSAPKGGGGGGHSSGGGSGHSGGGGGGHHGR